MIYNHIPTHFLIYIPELVHSTKVIMCHFSPVSTLNSPLKVTITWYWSLIYLIYSQKNSIPSIEVRKTFSPLKSQPNHITTTATKYANSLLYSLFTISWTYSLSHPIRSTLTTLLVTPKCCFLNNPILNFHPLINFSNYCLLMGHTVTVDLLPPRANMMSPMPNVSYP